MESYLQKIQNASLSQHIFWDGGTETPIFLETFSEMKIELTKFANNNINRLSCEAVMEHLRDTVIPKIYEKISKILWQQ